VVEPVAKALANPVALIEATVPFEELQVTELVRSWDDPSLNLPLAVNCCVAPTGIEGLLGLTVIELRLITVRVIMPVIGPDVACIVVVPTASAVANPEALIEATVVFEELQPTEPVTSCDDPSTTVAFAVNCWVLPTTTVGLLGATAIELTFVNT